MIVLMIPPPPIVPSTVPVPAMSWLCAVSGADTSKYRLAGRFGPIDASPEHPVADGTPEFEITEDESGRLKGNHSPGEYVNGNYLKNIDRSDRIYMLSFQFQPSAGKGSVWVDWFAKDRAALEMHEYGTCTVTPETRSERGQ